MWFCNVDEFNEEVQWSTLYVPQTLPHWIFDEVFKNRVYSTKLATVDELRVVVERGIGKLIIDMIVEIYDGVWIRNVLDLKTRVGFSSNCKMHLTNIDFII